MANGMGQVGACLPYDAVVFFAAGVFFFGGAGFFIRFMPWESPPVSGHCVWVCFKGKNREVFCKIDG